MYKKMLVLLDGSKLSETVFSYARELAGRLSIDLDLLHVCSPDESEQIIMRQAYLEHLAAKLRKESQAVLKKYSSSSVRNQISVKSTVLIGYPPEEILKYTDQNNIDLIMLSSLGRSGIRMWGLGSVADKIIHTAKVPVWLIPAQVHEDIILDKLPKRPMVIPLDGSWQAESVIPHAENIARQRGADSEMILINVGKQLTLPYSTWEQNKELLGGDISAFKLVSERYLDGVVKRLKADGFNARAAQLIGNVEDEIIRYVNKRPTQLIVMATHGRTGFSRLIFSSVTEKIIRAVNVPIFLIKPES